MYYAVTRTDELQHHGIKGQKWGVRRYQNADGSLTGAGRTRYGEGPGQRNATSILAASYRSGARQYARAEAKYTRQASRTNNAKRKQMLRTKATFARAGQTISTQRANNIQSAKNEYKNANRQFHKDTKNYTRHAKSFGITKKGKEKVKQSEKRFETAIESARKANEAKAKLIMAKHPNITLEQASKKVDRQNGAKTVAATLAYVGSAALTVAYTAKRL